MTQIGLRYFQGFHSLNSVIIQADWCSSKKPESDGNQQLFTSLPVILHDMVEENIKVGMRRLTLVSQCTHPNPSCPYLTPFQLAKSVSPELMIGVFRISMEQLSAFLDAHRSAFQVRSGKPSMGCPYQVKPSTKHAPTCYGPLNNKWFHYCSHSNYVTSAIGKTSCHIPFTPSLRSTTLVPS